LLLNGSLPAIGIAFRKKWLRITACFEDLVLENWFWALKKKS